MSALSIADLPPIPDFLAQFAESFGVAQQEALALLGDLLVSYEPSPSGEAQASPVTGSAPETATALRASSSGGLSRATLPQGSSTYASGAGLARLTA